MLPASRVPPPSPRAPNWGLEEARTWEHHPQPTIPPPRLNRQDESRRQPVVCISWGWARPYTRWKDPPTLIPRNQVSEGEGMMMRESTPKRCRVECGTILVGVEGGLHAACHTWVAYAPVCGSPFHRERAREWWMVAILSPWAKTTLTNVMWMLFWQPIDVLSLSFRITFGRCGSSES